MSVTKYDEKPFIHLMRTSSGYYLYDVNTDQIIDLPPDVYHYLKGEPLNDEKQENAIQNYVDKLKRDGYLKPNHIEISEHPQSELLEDFLDKKLSHITLQVTQMCNLRCEYCAYSGSYENRSHANRWMSFDTAKRAIDYFIKHSKESYDFFGLSFYGGEPLLAFDLIKNCVRYMDERAEGRVAKYNFTTNGTLLTKEKMEFLIEHQFHIVVSLDGPEFIHDKNRKFADNNRGSFATMMANIDMIRTMHPDFYKSNITFNTVFDNEHNFSCVNDFVINSAMFDQIRFSSSLIASSYSKSAVVYSDEFREEFAYEHFKLYLYKLGWCGREAISALTTNFFNTLKTTARMLETTVQDQLPSKSHHGGPCLPGVQRMFVDVDGVLYPCERVSETSDVTKIGDVYTGVDIEKAKKIMNIEQVTSDLCRNCWAYTYCSICIARADDGCNISRELITSYCAGVKDDVESQFLDYCVLKELGYNVGLDW